MDPIRSTGIASFVAQKSLAASLLSLPTEIQEKVREYLDPRDYGAFYEVLTTVTHMGKETKYLEQKLFLLLHKIPQQYRHAVVSSDALLQDFAGNQFRALLKLDDFSQVVENPRFFQLLYLVAKPEIWESLKECIQQKPALKQKLLNYVENSKTVTASAKIKANAANAMTLLIRANVQFNGADLKGIQIPRADLSEGQFDSAQLQGADLTGVKFHNTWLRHANLSGAQMDEVQLGEWVFLREDSEVHACAYSPQGDLLASACVGNSVRLGSVEPGRPHRTLLGHSDRVISVAYSPKIDQIASGSWDNTVRLWSAKTGQPGHILRGHTNKIASVAYSLKGNQIASCSWDNTVRLWSLETGQSIGTLSGHTHRVWSLSYSPSGARLASCSEDNSVRLWCVQTRETVRILSGHTDLVLCVTYAPQCDQIASGSRDNTVRLWSVETGRTIRILRGHTALVRKVAYSPQGDQIASCSDDDTVRLWSRGQPGLILRGQTGTVYDLAYSPQGDQIASCSQDKTVRLWNVRTGECQVVIKQLNEESTNIAWRATADRNYLITGSEDFSVRLWKLIKEGGQYKAQLRWSSRQPELIATETSIEGVQGLSQLNRMVLTQRGAVGKPLSLA